MWRPRGVASASVVVCPSPLTTYTVRTLRSCSSVLLEGQCGVRPQAVSAATAAINVVGETQASGHCMRTVISTSMQDGQCTIDDAKPSLSVCCKWTALTIVPNEELARKPFSRTSQRTSLFLVRLGYHWQRTGSSAVRHASQLDQRTPT